MFSSLGHFAHPSLNFYRGEKNEKWPEFWTPVDFESPAFINGITYLKSETNSENCQHKSSVVLSLENAVEN